MKIIPVIFRVHFSKTEILLKIIPIRLVPVDINMANSMRGRAVPVPKNNGKIIKDSCLIDNGIKLPKKRAAEIGQNERENRKPIKNAPK